MVVRMPANNQSMRMHVRNRVFFEHRWQVRVILNREKENMVSCANADLFSRSLERSVIRLLWSRLYCVGSQSNTCKIMSAFFREEKFFHLRERVPRLFESAK
ncbi:hypothetical protein TNIN_287511 [Trichonephila inaurata madagascariensis]|uniref:Uncharacterized protein n=1 Tax=Trichonephila inaurata madagascariensis TaxID=2747483 RepID=A0A8X7C1J0_9ARAC|nr:hypothetical protein TNIN_287511 [Trichonephila inaurata madagascariensis]